MRSILRTGLTGLILCLTGVHALGDEPVFRAGASVVDVSPPELPVIVNGGFLEARGEALRDPLNARALVLDDGTTRLAMVVVDSCMMPRELIDRAKAIASERTGLPVNRMLVSATHTHTAPSCMGALGSRADPGYVEFLPGRIAEAITRAVENLEPAEIGWGAVDLPDFTHCRRWIRRPDRMLNDPFGGLNVRANMHPGHESPDVIGPSGPVDPGLSILAVRSVGGRPIALLANYSMHYFGTSPISADYYGRFCEAIAREIAPGADVGSPFVAMMSQGTSGDQQWMDYGSARPEITMEDYAESIAAAALKVYRAVEFRPQVPLAMAESRLTLRRRVPDEARLAWARPIVEAMGDRVPKDQREVYAQEALFLHDEPERELILQAIAVGDLGIAAIPDEVYALTGLKLKARSPLAMTFTIELANGSEGYIPPPEQHALGGYTTWPARTAGLEVEAEPRIVDTVLQLLEQVASRPRRVESESHSAYAEAIEKSRPMAFWRLGEMDGRRAADATGSDRDARYEDGVALYLDGADAPGLGPGSRAAHFAGGRMAADLPELGEAYSVELWIWNGLPDDARAVTGYFASIGPDGAEDAPGDHLGLGGTHTAQGRLLFFNGNRAGEVLEGSTVIAPKTWHHVVLVRQGRRVTVYLDGRAEIEGEAAPTRPAGDSPLFLGGRSDGFANWEGKLDEAAVYDRGLNAEEVAAHHRAAEGR